MNGLAPAVINEGGYGFIGSNGLLEDKGATDFACRFYSLLTDRLRRGAPFYIADVLVETKRYFQQIDEPVFAAYVYFGNPNLKIIPPEDL